MVVAIASGKGGTGKTTLATALSLVHQGELTLLDADVEEPNCRFFLDIPEGDVEKRETPFTVPIPSIDEASCTGCGKCSSFCNYGALVRVGKRVLVFPNLCHSCGGCTLVCPEKAITELPHHIGAIMEADFTGAKEGAEGRRHLRHLHRLGLLDVGVATAPPLIREVKKLIPRRGEGPDKGDTDGGVQGDTGAGETSSDGASFEASQPAGINPTGVGYNPNSKNSSEEHLYLIDSPPGASCPMTTAVKGADLVILITENTPFGAHDLEKAAGALAEMDIPAVVVINRVDLGGGKAEELCARLGLPVIARILFLRDAAEAYARGEHPVLTVPQFREVVLDIDRQLPGLVAQASSQRSGSKGPTSGKHFEGGSRKGPAQNSGKSLSPTQKQKKEKKKEKGRG